MKTIWMYILVLVLAMGPRAAAGALVVHPSATAEVQAGTAQPSGCAIVFDLSQLPDSAHIDLAELAVKLDVDTLLVSGTVHTGADQPVEVNLTGLVRLWHTGRVANHGLIVSVPGNALRRVALAGLPQAAVTLTVFFSE